MIGTPASPTTILSAKLTSMNRNSRNVIFQASLGLGCVVMIFSPDDSYAGPFTGPSDATCGMSVKATGDFGLIALTTFRLSLPQASCKRITIASPHD